MLTVHTEYLSHENLASFHVGTPDPRLFCPTIGERLILSWNIPTSCQSSNDLHIKITIRFRNREQIEKNIDLQRFQGIYIYPLLDEDYFEKDGILTYKVELFSGEELLENWHHQLWAEQIILTP